MSLGKCPRAAIQHRGTRSPGFSARPSKNPFQPPCSVASQSSGFPLLQETKSYRAQAQTDDEYAERYVALNSSEIVSCPQEGIAQPRLELQSLRSGSKYRKASPPSHMWPVISIAPSTQVLSPAPQPGLCFKSPLQTHESQSANREAATISAEGENGHAANNISQRDCDGVSALVIGYSESAPLRLQLDSGTVKNRGKSEGSGVFAPKSATLNNEVILKQMTTHASSTTLSLIPKVGPVLATAASASKLAPPKSRRVRTGCLTCRERHLKCDEGTPDCINCRKGNRDCKRGLRLNFIDTQTKKIPYIPPATSWNGMLSGHSKNTRKIFLNHWQFLFSMSLVSLHRNI